MRIDLLVGRAIPAGVAIFFGLPMFALSVEAPGGSAPLVQVDSTLLYAMVTLAVVQVIFIVAMGGIMRTMGGANVISKWLQGKGGRAALLIPFLLALTQTANAQAYAGNSGAITNYQAFWALAICNLFLFIIMLAQISVLRGLTRAITGAKEEEHVFKASGPSWADNLLKKLTRQVPVEKEQDIMMDHEYDGIRELDNVLPPWWLWLLYGTIGFAVIYLINVHVIGVIPDQRTEYMEEMAQASLDVTAYKATLKNVIDETNVVASVEPAVLASGGAVFAQFCTPCHGADGAGSESSVGPNLTDAYWLHGGDATSIFHTIKYGVPEKGMISWKTQLKPAEIQAVASYILSLKGTGSATQKQPQGELWIGPAADDAVPDSVAAPQDSTRTAMLK